MSLLEKISSAVSDGELLESSEENIKRLISSTKDSVATNSLEELVDLGEWEELNDRFYQQLAFGTGGLRSRTIGKIITKAEQGNQPESSCPEYPAIGSNCMNFRNIARATRGMAEYAIEHHTNKRQEGNASIVFAHDTRHFSRAFAEHCAKVATEAGCDAYLFESHRSTPQLSFAVRHLNATAGAMITASHNPPHDNGFKVYFEDGAQIVEPHASLIIQKVNQLEGGEFPAVENKGTIHSIGSENDEAYLEKIQSVVLQPELLEKDTGLKIVFTNLHGVGGVHIPNILRKAGLQVDTVAEQDTEDGAFPTVASPNPENAPALQMAIDQANETNADIVIGTDPDCDRMGVACRNSEGDMQLITGNQIGSLLAWYRTKTFFDLGIINESNKQNATLIKTYVTTELQRAIAEGFGIACVDTLTGFKYIGEKLQKYESNLPAEIQENYRTRTADECRNIQLQHGRYFVFGGEESYGYLSSDFLRDKDGNMAALMFAELAAYAKSRDLTLPELLDEVWMSYGYYLEKNYAKVFEGAEGANIIKTLAKSYSENPPTEIDGAKVIETKDFNQTEFKDIEGDVIPKAAMMVITMDDGRTIAVRPSGTEPKIKYYLFGSQKPAGDSLSTSELSEAKVSVSGSLNSLWNALEADIEQKISA